VAWAAVEGCVAEHSPAPHRRRRVGAMADGEEGPSPNVYNITTDIINTVTPRAPSYSFGVMHSGTQFISEAHEAIKFGEVRT
jgi:hypothetical protein